MVALIQSGIQQEKKHSSYIFFVQFGVTASMNGIVLAKASDSVAFFLFLYLFLPFFWGRGEGVEFGGKWRNMAFYFPLSFLFFDVLLPFGHRTCVMDGVKETPMPPLPPFHFPVLCNLSRSKDLTLRVENQIQYLHIAGIFFFLPRRFSTLCCSF